MTKNPIDYWLVGGAGFVLGDPGGSGILIQIQEVFGMFLLGKRKKDEVMTEEVALSALMKLMSENDILEIELLVDGKLLKIGVSSNHDHRKKPDFFDKRYYIEDIEYSSADLFSHAFSQLSNRTMQTVVRIDGVEPCFYHFDR